jgi:FkbM family methyltransferase
MIFDIGANIGQWSLANIATCDKIIALEPIPKTFKALVNNCKNHNIICENFAVCNNNNNDITFYEATRYHTISTLYKGWLTDHRSRFYNQPFRETTVKTITMDDLIKKHGVPDFIKIDVEGGEYECISSLNQKVDLLAFEWASELSGLAGRCLDHLSKLGFTEFYLQFEDSYTFRPKEFYDLATIKTKLAKTIQKKDWGMIWCK